MGRVDNIMNEEKQSKNSSPAELIEAKFRELKYSQFSKYFFLYFIHLLGHLNYNEENGQAVFSDKKSKFIVPLPVIDSEEQFNELERIHKKLEMFYVHLKTLEPEDHPEEIMKLNLLENI
jgi:hypothetical protein